MIPDQVLEQLASCAFDKAQVIIVTKMLLVTAENARAQVRAEMREELSAMRADYGRLIIEAVAATEGKIFARLEEEREREEEKKRKRREAAAARKKEREALKAAQLAADAGQIDMFGADGGGDFVKVGNVAKVLIEDEDKSDIGVVGDGGELPRSRGATYAPPVTGHLAAKFEENEAFRELKAQCEARQLRGETATRPIGSPLASLKSLGEALIEGWSEELEAQEQLEGAGQDVLMIKQAGVAEMLQAAE